jgi:hypothetical protein
LCLLMKSMFVFQIFNLWERFKEEYDLNLSIIYF